MDKLY